MTWDSTLVTLCMENISMAKCGQRNMFPEPTKNTIWGVGVEAFYFVMRIATGSSIFLDESEAGLCPCSSWPMLKFYSGADFRRISEAFKYQKGKDCLASESVKGVTHLPKSPRWPLFWSGCPRGKPTPGHGSRATGQRIHVGATPFPSASHASRRSRDGKVCRVSPILRLQQSERRENPKGRIEGAGIGERGAVSDNA